MTNKKPSKRPAGKKGRKPVKKNGGRSRSPRPNRRLPGDITTDAPPPRPKPTDED